MIKYLKNKLQQEQKILLKIKVNTLAGKDQIKDVLEDGTFKIDISQAPEKGKANEELIKILAKEFNVGKENIKIIRGGKSKLKTIKINK